MSPFLPIRVSLFSSRTSPKLPEFLFLPRSKISSFHAGPATPIKCFHPPRKKSLTSRVCVRPTPPPSHHPSPKPTKASLVSAFSLFPRGPPTRTSSILPNRPRNGSVGSGLYHTHTHTHTHPAAHPSSCSWTPPPGMHGLCRPCVMRRGLPRV